jgi:hypothetical protein
LGFNGDSVKVTDSGLSNVVTSLNTLSSSLSSIAPTQVQQDDSWTDEVIGDASTSYVKTKDSGIPNVITAINSLSSSLSNSVSTPTQQDPSWMGNIIGDSASKYVKTKDILLSYAVDQSLGALKTSITGVTFDGDALLVSNSASATTNNYLSNIHTKPSTLVERPTSAMTATDIVSAMNSGSAAYTLVKNEILDDVYDGSTSTLNVSVRGFTFTNNNSLDVSDAGLNATNTHLSEIHKMFSEFMGRPQSTLTASDILQATNSEETAHTLVKNAVLDSVYDSGSNSLLVSIYGATYNDGKLVVHNSELSSVDTHLSSIDTNVQSFIDREITVGDIHSLIESLIGDGASDYIWTKDISSYNAFDEATSSIKVTPLGLEVTEGYLKVVDDGSLKTTAEKLTSILTHLTEKVVKIEFNDSQSIKFDKTVQNVLENAIRNAMFGGNEVSDGVNLTNMVNAVASGELKIRSITDSVEVKNATGDKLQVSNLVW